MQKIGEHLEKVENEFNAFALALEHDLDILYEECVEIQEIILGYREKIDKMDSRIRALHLLLEDHNIKNNLTHDDWCSLPPCGGSQGGITSCKTWAARAEKEAVTYMKIAVKGLSPGERLLFSNHQLIHLAKIHMDSSDLPLDLTNHVTLDMWNKAVDKVKTDLDWSIKEYPTNPN